MKKADRNDEWGIKRYGSTAENASVAGKLTEVLKTWRKQ